MRTILGAILMAVSLVAAAGWGCPPGTRERCFRDTNGQVWCQCASVWER